MDDLNDFARKHGPEKVVEIERARERMRKAEQEQRENAKDAQGSDEFPIEWAKDIELSFGGNDFVEDLLCAENMSVVYGDSNSGKTFFMVDVAMHVACDMEWNGRIVEQGGVVYVAAEGPNSVKMRVETFKRHHGLVGQDIPFAIIGSQVDLRSEDGDTSKLINTINAAAAQIEEQHGIPVRLVVIDTLSRVMAGGNENASEDMGALVRNLDRIKLTTGAHVCTVHHCGKDASKGARGHSLLRAATDTEIEVAKDGDAGITRARVTKQRDLPTGAEFAFTLKVIELGTNRHGKPVTSCVIEPTDAPAKKKSGLPQSAAQALKKLADCINSIGVTPPHDRDIPSNVTAVTLDQWREFLKKSGVTEDAGKPDAARQQYGRAKKGLLAAGRIGIWDNWVWIVKSEDQ
jgi:KaiC/GvpD/RAD55 family RecA-like ATPase